MKKQLVIFSIIGLFACHTADNKIDITTVSVSILPQKYFIDQLTGNYLQVNVMVPPGASPATYEPTPKQLANISKSKAYFRIGEIIFEQTWMDKFTSNNPGMGVYNLSENIEFAASPGHNNHGHEHLKDPHIWMSPKKAKIVVSNLHQNLQHLYPEFTDTLQMNYNQFMIRIDSLDQLFERKTKTLKQKSFIIFHPALTYLAEDYGLQQIPIEFEGKEPSPVHLQEIIKQAEKQAITTIFVQREFNKENARAIASEIGARIVEIDPLGYDWEKNMLEILNKL